MQNIITKLLRTTFLIVVLVSSTTLLRAQNPGGPLDGGGSDTAVVPVKTIILSVYQDNNNVTITWNTIGETQLASFTIEKSENGKTFSAFYTIVAKNQSAASYQTFDKTTTAAYYRIKATDIKGSYTYSAIKYFGGNKSLSIKVFPNPLVGNTLHISTGNLTSGTYQLVVINGLGQKCFSSLIEGASTTTDVKIGNLSSGNYTVIVFSGNTIVDTKTLLVK